MKLLFTLFISAAISCPLFAQQQFENGNFESWENVGTAEEEPTDWSSLKTADALAGSAPKVISQDVGRNGGFCPKLEVKEVFGIRANGILTNGRVHADFNPENGYVFTDINDPRWRTQFTDRPDSLVGWYKYAPQGGDKGKVEAVLHVSSGSLPYNGTEGNMIGHVKMEFLTAQPDWTRFAKAFEYNSSQAPEYLLTVITSGDSTVSQTGSTLWVDDLSFVYNPAGVAKNNATKEFAINGSNGYLYFDVKDNSAEYFVYDISGKIVQKGKAEEKLPFNHNNGIYFITIKTAETSFTKKLYIR